MGDEVGFEQQQPDPGPALPAPSAPTVQEVQVANKETAERDRNVAHAVALDTIATYQQKKSKAWLSAGLIMLFVFFVVWAWAWEFGIWMFLENAQSIGYLNIAGGNSFVNTVIRFMSLFTVVGGFVVAVAVGAVGVLQINNLTLDVQYWAKYEGSYQVTVGMGISGVTTIEDTATASAATIAALVFMYLGFASMLLDSIFHGVEYAATGQGYTPVEQDYALWVCISSAIGAGAALACCIAATFLYLYTRDMLDFLKSTVIDNGAFLRDQMEKYLYDVESKKQRAQGKMKKQVNYYGGADTRPSYAGGAIRGPPSAGISMFSASRVPANGGSYQRPGVGRRETALTGMQRAQQQQQPQRK
jgi:hypothetical protein